MSGRRTGNKKNKKKQGHKSRTRLLWLASGGGLAIVAVIAAVVLLSSGSEGSPTRTVAPRTDARVAGATPAASYRVEAGDSGQNVNPYFEPRTLRAPAGEVFEIVMDNVGTVHHNIRVSGPDGRYGTADDFEMTPLSVAAGSTGRVLVKIDEPGSYPFHCDFHPQQNGTLIIE